MSAIGEQRMCHAVFAEMAKPKQKVRQASADSDAPPELWIVTSVQPSTGIVGVGNAPPVLPPEGLVLPQPSAPLIFPRTLEEVGGQAACFVSESLYAPIACAREIPPETLSLLLGARLMEHRKLRAFLSPDAGGLAKARRELENIHPSEGTERIADILRRTEAFAALEEHDISFDAVSNALPGSILDCWQQGPLHSPACFQLAHMDPYRVLDTMLPVGMVVDLKDSAFTSELIQLEKYTGVYGKDGRHSFLDVYLSRTTRFTWVATLWHTNTNETSRLRVRTALEFVDKSIVVACARIGLLTDEAADERFSKTTGLASFGPGRPRFIDRATSPLPVFSPERSGTIIRSSQFAARSIVFQSVEGAREWPRTSAGGRTVAMGPLRNEARPNRRLSSTSGCEYAIIEQGNHDALPEPILTLHPTSRPAPAPSLESIQEQLLAYLRACETPEQIADAMRSIVHEMFGQEWERRVMRAESAEDVRRVLEARIAVAMEESRRTVDFTAGPPSEKESPPEEELRVREELLAALDQKSRAVLESANDNLEEVRTIAEAETRGSYRLLKVSELRQGSIVLKELGKAKTTGIVTRRGRTGEHALIKPYVPGDVYDREEFSHSLYSSAGALIKEAFAGKRILIVEGQRRVPLALFAPVTPEAEAFLRRAARRK